jgi:hypothetical protein
VCNYQNESTFVIDNYFLDHQCRYVLSFWEIKKNRYRFNYLAGLSQLLNTVHIHKTNAAAEKINDLWCYSCDSTEGDECLSPTENRSSLIKKCKPDEFVCMVCDFCEFYDYQGNICFNSSRSNDFPSLLVMRIQLLIPSK